MRSLNRIVIKLLNTILSLAVVSILLVSGCFSLFALWDNQKVYQRAENVQKQMLQLKPSIEPAQGGVEQFATLKEINPDVCAWLTLDGTQIDYPILQGSDNYAYINTDVYGNYALAGSIFLDAANDSEFLNAYSLLYGHHMSGSRMFGDLDNYKDRAFFDSNTSGTLILPNKAYDLAIFAVMIVPASEHTIFNAAQYKNDAPSVLEFVNSNALYFRQSVVDDMEAADIQLIAFSTCASDYTDARTVVLARMRELK